MRWVGCTGGRQGSDAHRVWLSRAPMSGAPLARQRTLATTRDPIPSLARSGMHAVALARETLQALPLHRRSHPFLTFPFPLFG